MKHTNSLKNALFLGLVMPLLFSCNNDFKQPDTSNINIDIKVHPFYKDIFKPYDDINQHIESLYASYDTFFVNLCKSQLYIGNPSDSLFASQFEKFIKYKDNIDVIPSCDSLWASLDNIDEKITDGMKCMKFYFPNINTPNVLAHFSGFNSKIMVDSTHLSFSIEHYLGRDCRFYTWLEIPQYARFTKSKEYIVSDLIKAWIYANLPDTSDKDDILTAMIYQGKVIYATKACLPDTPLQTIMGYDDQQMVWCEKAEADMWGFMIEEKLIYNSNPLDKIKLINDAPYTPFFGQQSPGRAALWCGFNIVKQYMQNNPNTTLHQLFNITDAQKILIGSQYQP